MIKAIVTDIEGTTTSVSFVYDTLFPYFLNHIDELITLKSTNKDVEICFDNIKKTTLDEAGLSINDSEVLQKLKLWVEQDIKEPNLKKMQGIIWDQAYRNGKIKGHLYNDFLPAIKFWKSQNILLAVYSSGSIQAQKLLFEFSIEGDITPYFASYFDTGIGHKRQSESYQNIAVSLQLEPNNILFLSDVEEELDAAKIAGFNTIQLVREGTIPSKKHSTAPNFSAIKLP